MKEKILSIISTLAPWLNPGPNNGRAGSIKTDEPPLRSELFSAAQMQEHGKVLANAHQLSQTPFKDQLLIRLADNERVLTGTCQLLRDATKVGRQITPAAEWLLDNLYLIEEQIRTAKQHLPKGYSKELPRLLKAGYPRVYDIALETISHGDGRVDPDGLRRFVASYQEVNVLKLGELWAIPIMLRLALIENLRRVSARLTTDRHHRNLAHDWADKMIHTADKEPSDLILLVADMARSNPPMVGSFVAELVRRLQGQGPSLMLPLTWLSQHLAESGQTTEELIQIENQQQAADQVSISNSIGSLRFLGSLDWREFVESMSVVDQTLRRDSAGIYARMDFATRDYYRHIIERISRNTLLSEVDIANYAMDLAKNGAAKHGPDSRQAHVGYYLTDKGLPQLEHLSRIRLSKWESFHRMCDRSPLVFYLGPIIVLSTIFTAALLVETRGHELHPAIIVALAIVSLLATSQLAIALMNWLVTLWATPHYLPRMDFSTGIPHDCATLVAVPTLLLDADNVEHLCDNLEIRYLANRDKNLRFCLLTDFTDAATETTEQDAHLLLLAQENIAQLNAKYRSDESKAQDRPGDSFLLLHRPRRWNNQEKIWMGYERKRGKLADLNAFLRDPVNNHFSVIVGDTTDLTDIRYVITLDTDTLLARDSARQFVGAMAHPLNRPHYDEHKRRVTEGYGILQPRVSTSLPSDHASRYALLYGGEPGIDPYTRTVSDVYQDVFREGSFIGKGIYDVDAFEKSLSHRLPDNRILSHDLLEGCYARCGLISDVQLHEEYPTRYSADVKRRHRWIRGDWQLLAWLLPRVPAKSPDNPDKRSEPNPLSALSRWKLLDNLRRSIASTTLTLLLLMGWSVLPTAWLWTTTVLSVVFLPPFLASLIDLLRKPEDVLLRQHVLATARYSRQRFEQALLWLAFLPYETLFSLDAIARTLWRLLISHKNLLEWNPSHADRSEDQDLLGYYRRMAVNPVLALVSAIVLATTRPDALWIVATPVMLLWFVAPAIAWWISQPLAHDVARLTQTQTAFLHRLTRKTWAFFETYVGAEDNWLPPDNVQMDPVALLAHRTSPTNIGLALLANLSAYDFGYIPAGQLLDRCERSLQTMSMLERHQGHFYNWYDTRTLAPLLPMYISTVDSGNLAGHLLTLRPGLLQLLDQPIVAPRLFQGIQDTFEVFCEAAPDPNTAELSEFRLYLSAACDAPPTTLDETLRRLLYLQKLAENLEQNLPATDAALPQRWAQALVRHCAGAADELRQLAPWLDLMHSTEQHTDLRELVGTIPTLRSLAGLQVQLENRGVGIQTGELAILIGQASRTATQRITQIEHMVLQLAEFSRMEYGFLYNSATDLLAIGYNVSERRRDSGHYDLLASEARLCNFVAIAQGQLPQDSWFALGRQLTIAGGDPILLSWSGSMFEYLMPLLVMPRYDNTLLDQTYKAAVTRQIDYGMQRNVPWGLSESGYYTFDTSLNYQYRAFGVPGLGMRRGLGDDLVIAPYASMLALMVAPEAACLNLQKMADYDFQGEFGFYEAIDYTPVRLPRGKSYAIVKSYMTHHQGMAFLSLNHLLLDRAMHKRFESDPLFQATLLLLQERIPKATASYFDTAELADIRMVSDTQQMPMRILKRADTKRPEVQLLSNGRYHVMVSNSGGGSSRWRDLAVTRWREDPTRDHWGTFCYIRDLDDGVFWSTTWHPTRIQPERYEVIFSEDRAEFRRYDNGIDTYTEIVVSPEDDIELRRSKITNRSRTRRSIEVTSYQEVVLAPSAADASHPAFSNLFVQTEILESQRAVICTRRPRSRGEKMPWMLNLMTAHGATVGAASFETDRARFIGRGNQLAAPIALTGHEPLSGSQGSVLDPIVAIRYQITLNPEQSVTIDRVTGVAETRAQALHLIDKYQDRYLADRVFELAWTHNHVVLRQLNASDTDAQLYSRMASSIVYTNSLLRADASVLINNRRQQSDLWGYGISGDLPIVLLQIKSAENIDLVRQLVQAHAYWRMKGLAVDLVIWNEDHAGYRQLLQDQIIGLIVSGVEAQTIDRPGGIFVRMADQISNEDRILIQSVARLILVDSHGTLTEQLSRRSVPDSLPAVLIPSRRPPDSPLPLVLSDQASADEDHLLHNGLGGFSADGREYVITTSTTCRTPAPWVNVLANANFGSVISESGQAYTWAENAHEFRLSPWDNDPVSDLSGEAFYLRDEQSGHVWSPTALPCRGRGDYVTRHGFGYSIFEHTENGIHTELTVFVAPEASIKYSVLKVRNATDETQSLSATGYVEWVLGDLPFKTDMHIVTETDPVSGALLARNAYSAEFSSYTAFFDVDATMCSQTGDRTEFIGRNGTLQYPAALGRVRLSGKVGAEYDPCAAIQVPFELVAGQEREIVFMLGTINSDRSEVGSLIQRYRGAEMARNVLDDVRCYWQATLGAVQIDTPDTSLNVLANGWLMYQTIASRLWARSGYYQSGGAYGFRDQLQDVMAVVHTEPRLARQQLLRAAAHQFIEGDVQHWWHPPSDRGVRTHCSDDYLWLPLSTCRYVVSTGDTGVLDETAHFLEGRPVGADEDSYYDLPLRSSSSASLYQHCVRAIVHGLRFGAHGLPLIGSCDWNDGMDKVGEKGKGESVWLGFFLYDVLTRFAPIAVLKGDTEFAERCQREAARLRTDIEANAWDGQWYRRAYFDDGTPLGSASNTECQIDSISQSWSVLSGAGDPARSASGMQAVNQRLVRRDSRLIQLLDPPFDTSRLDPGYIRGYVPGVRENGGQYTHAAIWTVMAFAQLGDQETAWELLDLINPISHGATAQNIEVYKVEPYVMAADVYAVAPHVGRGGWTWYTGSSGWMYRLIIESLLGLHVEDDRLSMAPCLPARWPSFTMNYRYKRSVYRIQVRHAEPGNEAVLTLDGVAQSDAVIQMIDDGNDHQIDLTVASPSNVQAVAADLASS